MAVMTSGAPAAPTHSPITRTRVCHGSLSFGSCPAGVYTSRREGDARVSVEIACDGVLITGRLSAVQARAMAKALLSAADAAGASQRFVRGAA
ncbi:hypothetical protein [Aquabacterium sp.]|uniref:hypothetical protein n=1 Tax=Aquabacterium sp. TaxID=1872578 RepID=UPI003784C0BE